MINSIKKIVKNVDVLKVGGILLSIAGAGITFGSNIIDEKKRDRVIAEEVKKQVEEYLSNRE